MSEEEAVRTGKERLLLTVAVAAGKITIDVSYDIPGMARCLDFISLMSYDLHGSWETITDHNSPLFKRSGEHGDLAYLNVQAAANYWITKGCPSKKLIIGLPTYGRSFTLADPNKWCMGAPASRAGPAGPYTREAGVLIIGSTVLKMFDLSPYTPCYVSLTDYELYVTWTNFTRLPPSPGVKSFRLGQITYTTCSVV